MILIELFDTLGAEPHTSYQFTNVDSARQAFWRPEAHNGFRKDVIFAEKYDVDLWARVVLDDGTLFEQRRVVTSSETQEEELLDVEEPEADARLVRFEDEAARSEFAMQQGMTFGIDAYNEAMGFDTTPGE